MKITFKTPYQQEPERIGGVKIPYAKGKRAAARWRWYIIVLIVTSPLLFLLIKILLSYLIVTAPGYLSLEKVPINSNSTGIVS
ncbi:MAG: HlyD family secretion protein, partial [Desulfobulbus propionicus]